MLSYEALMEAVRQLRTEKTIIIHPDDTLMICRGLRREGFRIRRKRHEGVKLSILTATKNLMEVTLLVYIKHNQPGWAYLIDAPFVYINKPTPEDLRQLSKEWAEKMTREITAQVVEEMKASFRTDFIIREPRFTPTRNIWQWYNPGTKTHFTPPDDIT